MAGVECSEIDNSIAAMTLNLDPGDLSAKYWHENVHCYNFENDNSIAAMTLIFDPGDLSAKYWHENVHCYNFENRFLGFDVKSV